jgi:hypothetical protein
MSRFLAASMAFLLPAAARAQGVPAMQVICTGLAGCPEGPENALFNNVLPIAIQVMIQLAAGGAVIFIIINGAKMLLSYGDDSKAQAARKGVLQALGGLGLALVSATIVSFVTTENYGQNNPQDFLFGSGGLLDATVRISVLLFNVGFTVMAILGGYRMMTASGAPDEFKKGGTILKWAVVGAVVVNLARALVLAFLQLRL